MSNTQLADDTFDGLERGDVREVWERLAESVQRHVTTEALGRWNPGLDEWVGSPRRVVERSGLAEAQDAVRLIIEGSRGRVSATFRFDDQQRITALELAPWVTDGIRNIVIGTPRGFWDEEAERVDGEPRQLGEFYSALLGMRILRDDWIVVGADDSQHPRLAFGDGWSDERTPRWGDPEYPQQVHLDIFVPDVEAAGALALGRGATALSDRGDHRIYADPFGHAFCLYEDADGSTDGGRIGRVVFDCADPSEPAAFWAELLEMHERAEDRPERVVIGRSDGALPKLAFQRVDNFIAPRWGDPAFPEQMHLDLQFNDPHGARRLAEQLGATSIPPPRGSCPVYTDPAGHPFCLCSSAGSEEPYVMDVLSRE
jgi:hypothetical protein